jgi:hypothetical protein
VAAAAYQRDSIARLLFALFWASTPCIYTRSVRAAELQSSRQSSQYQGKPVALALAGFAGGFHLCSRPTPVGMSGFWTVSSAQMARIDVALLRHLHATELEKHLTFPPSGYLRQYLGSVRDGARVVYINAALVKEGSSTIAYAQRHFVEGCDGGGMFWGIEYHMKTKSFRAFATNAE